MGGAEGLLQKFGTDAIEAEAEHESKQDAALSELRGRQGTLEQGVASFMDELRTEMLAGEEGARVDLAAERDERLASGTEAMVAAAELQAWAEAAVAQQATELEAAVLGSVAEGLVASAATESARYDAEVRHTALAAEVAAQREAIEAAFAEEKRKSWEQVSEQGAALMGELAEEAEARAKGEAELREMMSTRCGALEEAASSARVETEAAVQQALSDVVVEATVERLRAATAGDGEALRVTGELSALGERCGAVEAELQAQAAQLAARVDEQQRQAEVKGEADAQRRGATSAAIEARAAVEETMERLMLALERGEEVEREERRDVQIAGLQQAIALLAREQQEQGESGAAKQHGVEQAAEASLVRLRAQMEAAREAAEAAERGAAEGAAAVAVAAEEKLGEQLVSLRAELEAAVAASAASRQEAEAQAKAAAEQAALLQSEVSRLKANPITLTLTTLTL